VRQRTTGNWSGHRWVRVGGGGVMGFACLGERRGGGGLRQGKAATKVAEE
jgi:hypothetical protein